MYLNKYAAFVEVGVQLCRIKSNMAAKRGFYLTVSLVVPFHGCIKLVKCTDVNEEVSFSVIIWRIVQFLLRVLTYRFDDGPCIGRN